MLNNAELLKYLDQQPSNKKLVIAAFFITSKKALRELHYQWKLRDKAHGKIFKKNATKIKAMNENSFGGSVILIDLLNLAYGVMSEIEVPLAFGLLVNHKNKSLYVTSGKKIIEIKRRKRVSTISNNLFNDLHCIKFSLENNILAVSAGTDSILEIFTNGKEKICWDWLATENGFSFNCSGKERIIKRDFDYRLITTTTPEHTTHINSILNDKPNRILATLFHQRQLIKINKRTKKSNVLLSGLKSPHNIRKRRNGFILSDSRANRVLLLNKEFKVKKILKNSFDWVQDSLEFEKNQYLVADSNNYRLLLIDNWGNIKACFKWPKNSRRIASMEIISAIEAKSVFCL